MCLLAAESSKHFGGKKRKEEKKEKKRVKMGRYVFLFGASEVRGKLSAPTCDRRRDEGLQPSPAFSNEPRRTMGLI